MPPSALLNIFTLAPLYAPGILPLLGSPLPSSFPPLNSTQAITLHLYLNWHNPLDPFAPYIKTLPQEFDDHPLSWVVKARDDPATSRYSDLLSLLPPDANRKVMSVDARLRSDWITVTNMLVRYRGLVNRFTFSETR